MEIGNDAHLLRKILKQQHEDDNEKALETLLKRTVAC